MNYDELEKTMARLNPEQRRAVTYPDESVLVLAGAGSGKTTVLTARIAWLIARRRARPGGVMAVTFTNKAAREMKKRIALYTGYDAARMWIGTFHGLANRFLRINAELAGLPPSFSIIAPDDQLAILKDAMAQNGFPDHVTAKEALRYLSNAKEKGLRPDDLSPQGGRERLLLRAYKLYESARERLGAADFAELLLRSFEVLRDRPELRASYAGRFSHILVDEFQDTSVFQYKWVKMFRDARNSIFAVGDDDQSIYSFRGADVANMSRFRDEGAREIVKLETNYRSQKYILDAANAVIALNEGRIGKALRPHTNKASPIRLAQASSDRSEAEFVAAEIDRARAENPGLRYADFAVLYRNNALSRNIETALNRHGAPYAIYGGLRFFDRAEVKTAVAYLRLCVNPDDDQAFARCVNTPPRGIGRSAVERVADYAREHDCSMWVAAETIALDTPKLAVFLRLIQSLARGADALSFGAFAQCAIRDSGLLEMCEKLDRKDSAERALARVDNLGQLIAACEEFERDDAALDFDDWLDEGDWDPVEAGSEAAARGDDLLGLGAARVRPPAAPTAQKRSTLQTAAAFAGALSLGNVDDEEDNRLKGEGAVQLMTVHASKGLEFDQVFVIGAEDMTFPSSQSIQAGNIEEERRLMYVAITRAKNGLTICSADARMGYGSYEMKIPSRFLSDLPPSIVKRVSCGYESEDAGLYGRLAPQLGRAGSGNGAFNARRKTPRISGFSSSASLGDLLSGLDLNDEEKNKILGCAKGRNPQSGGAPAGSARDLDAEQADRIEAAARLAQDAQSRDLSSLKPGDKVRHDKFGPGLVTGLGLRGGRCTVDIQFSDGSARTLLLEIAVKSLRLIGR